MKFLIPVHGTDKSEEKLHTRLSFVYGPFSDDEDLVKISNELWPGDHVSKVIVLSGEILGLNQDKVE